MGVSYRNNGMSAIKVEIFVAVLVSHIAAFSFDYVDVEKGIYVV